MKRVKTHAGVADMADGLYERTSTNNKLYMWRVGKGTLLLLVELIMWLKSMFLS